MQRFEITFGTNGIASSETILPDDDDDGAEFVRGFTEQSINENLFPGDVRAVLAIQAARACGEGDNSTEVQVQVRLLIAAENFAKAFTFEPPKCLLTKVTDGFFGEGTSGLNLDNNWVVSMIRVWGDEDTPAPEALSLN